MKDGQWYAVVHYSVPHVLRMPIYKFRMSARNAEDAASRALAKLAGVLQQEESALRPRLGTDIHIIVVPDNFKVLDCTGGNVELGALLMRQLCPTTNVVSVSGLSRSAVDHYAPDLIVSPHLPKFPTDVPVMLV